MNDSELLEQIGTAHGARIAEAYRRMTDAAVLSRRERLVLLDMLVQSVEAARIDGIAMAGRNLEELGIEVAPGYLRPTSQAGWQAERNAAVQRIGKTRQRFDKALETILAGGVDGDALMRLERLALSETVEAARGTLAETMRGTELMEGWVRELDSDPCELCRWWWRDGRVWPADHAIPVHKGCCCAQRWVAVPRASVRYVSAEGQHSSAERHAAGTADERRLMNVSDYSSTSRGFNNGGTD